MGPDDKGESITLTPRQYHELARCWKWAKTHGYKPMHNNTSAPISRLLNQWYIIGVTDCGFEDDVSH